MVYGDLSAFCLTALACASSIALFVSLKARRARNLRLTSFLVLDFAIVVVLPLVLSTLILLPSAMIQRLFLSGFLFYLAIGVIYLLFTSNAARLLIPFISLYLVLIVALLSLRFPYDPLGSSLVLFAYYLSDEITLATFTVTFLAVLLPLSRQIGSRIRIVLDSRHLDSIASTTETRHDGSGYSASNRNQEVPSICPSTSPLRKVVRLYRTGDYKQCIESCDTELERVILSKLVELFSANIDLPMSLGDQISKLISREASLPGRDILQLRKLRNSLTMSSQEATAHQAKWAIRLMRRTKRVLESPNTPERHSEES